MPFLPKFIRNLCNIRHACIRISKAEKSAGGNPMTRGNLTIFMVLLVLLILWPVKGLAENQYKLLSVLTGDYVFDTIQ